MIICIDGTAGSGKSTLAEEVSKILNIFHFNSGLLFRAVTAYLLENKFNISKINENSKILDFTLSTKFVNNIQHVFVNKKDYTKILRNNEISVNVSKVAINKFVREKIDACQHEFAQHNDFIIEGRDTGSHVFPNADYKFYLTCNIKERAKRRYLEEKEKNSLITMKAIYNQIKMRDNDDKNRKIAPLVVPKNAIKINSSKKSIEELSKIILNCIKK